MNEMAEDVVLVGESQYVPLDRFRNPEKRGISDRMDILAPVGLQRFAEMVVFPALDSYELPPDASRIRLAPVTELKDFEPVAFYSLGKDYFRVSVPLNELRFYFYEKALPILDQLVWELTPYLESLSSETYEAFEMSREEVIEAIEYPLPDPVRPDGSSSTYHLEKRFHILEQAVDLYMQFESTIKNSPENRLPVDQKEKLVSLIRLLETRIMEVDRDRVASYFNIAPSRMQPPYDLFFAGKIPSALFDMIIHTPRRHLDRSRPSEHVEEFEESVRDSIEHEYQHQIFARMGDPYIIEATKNPDDPQAVGSEVPEQARKGKDDEEKERKKVMEEAKWRFKQRVKIISNAIIKFDKGRIDLKKALQTFSSISAGLSQELLPRIPDGAEQKRVLMFASAVGMQESVIAMLRAHKHKTDFLEVLSPYVASIGFGSLLPNADVLFQLKMLVDQYGDTPQQCLDEVIKRFYTKDVLERRALDVLQMATHFTHGRAPRLWREKESSRFFGLIPQRN
jgi:hypothetical protein